MAQGVSGDRYKEIDGQLFEIKRQLRQKSGYPFDLDALELALQVIVEGRFDGNESVKASILELVGMVTIPAIGQFITKDHFVEDVTDTARVKISLLSHNFKSWFLDKTEAPAAEATLRYSKLVKSSTDGPILAGLDSPETTLSHIFWLMEQQKNGKKGVLLVNGYANVFYVRDVNGTLRAVDVRWLGGGWGVRADSFAGPRGWREGRQVFSRNSS